MMKILVHYVNEKFYGRAAIQATENVMRSCEVMAVRELRAFASGSMGVVYTWLGCHVRRDDL